MSLGDLGADQGKIYDHEVAVALFGMFPQVCLARDHPELWGSWVAIQNGRRARKLPGERDVREGSHVSR